MASSATCNNVAESTNNTAKQPQTSTKRKRKIPHSEQRVMGLAIDCKEEEDLQAVVVFVST